MTELTLGFGLAFTDLYENAGLEKLDRRFIAWLGETDGDLTRRLLEARAQPDRAAAFAGGESGLLTALAPHLDDFIGELFGIGGPLRQLAARHQALTPLYAAKRLFVQRRAAKSFTPELAAGLDGIALTSALEAHLGVQFDELTFAARVLDWLADGPPMPPNWTSPPATPPGRCGRRRAGNGTAMACCSRSRKRPIPPGWCRWKPSGTKPA